MALKFYYACFAERYDNDPSIDVEVDTLDWFLIDYFGLDRTEIIRGKIRSIKAGKETWISYGLGFIDVKGGDKRFKEYCRRYVNEWRAEREMI